LPVKHPEILRYDKDRSHRGALRSQTFKGVRGSVFVDRLDWRLQRSVLLDEQKSETVC
jgi:hypothetical protein